MLVCPITFVPVQMEGRCKKKKKKKIAVIPKLLNPTVCTYK